VVVVNGYNDVSLAVRLNRVGKANGVGALQQRLALGSRGFWGELLGLGRHSELIVRLTRMVATPPATPPATGDICLVGAEYYSRIARAMTGLGAQFGFPVWFFLQPMHFLSGKPATAWERDLTARTTRPDELRRCMLAIDSVMSRQSAVNYVSLHRIFDADTASVFIDPHGHLTESASDRVAACIAAIVRPALKGGESHPSAVPPGCPAPGPSPRSSAEQSAGGPAP
jgi:hypothetical protein